MPNGKNNQVYADDSPFIATGVMMAVLVGGMALWTSHNEKLAVEAFNKTSFADKITAVQHGSAKVVCTDKATQKHYQPVNKSDSAEAITAAVNQPGCKFEI